METTNFEKYETVFKMFEDGSVVEGGGEQGSVYDNDLCTNIILRSSPKARTETESGSRGQTSSISGGQVYAAPWAFRKQTNREG